MTLQLTDELRYKLLKALELDPNMSQRQIAKELGISLGKVNFCINALLEVGWIKAKNFTNSKNKLAYAYLLTPKGVEEKLQVTQRFLDKKVKELEDIKRDIEDISRDIFPTEINTFETKSKADKE